MAGRDREERRRAYRAGRLAEDVAVIWLRLKGYRILARRYRHPAGEVDIVARRGRHLVAVEVKRRADIATALDAITPRQRRRIARGLEGFLAVRPALAGLDVRFDVILVAGFRRPCHILDAWRL
ncbi:YraN family protein [Oceanibacterium hippocampi]|uniref:UPF0102 protein OCH7691_00363 n=1 Tax=Oceanibacterium hippocampi TaxID=745714 RepID=A0A1Y5RJQ3_9PROT|nr:YraN family protein [Oceanibacterium hippocampi]SLN17910.1 hypothetical protein OCH7691_00363 [Oceanibacterium hippocampi]